MHYTELFVQLKSSGFNCGIYDDEKVVSQPRIYLNGYGDKVRVYLFADVSRRQNDYCNPISGYGLQIQNDEILDAKRKLLRRCKLKHIVMNDLHAKGFALKPVSEWKVISF